ncbi:hypothetical protein pb186bvf_019650 [Paramecium bursaria]
MSRLIIPLQQRKIYINYRKSFINSVLSRQVQLPNQQNIFHKIINIIIKMFSIRK